MLIGYDPTDGNKIKFFFRGEFLLENLSRKWGRPPRVSDFWQDDRGLVSVLIAPDTISDVDDPTDYQYDPATGKVIKIST